ncbi:uncharacterized protein [Porites lutea]|uniref:uncharacterized protein isoform X2 n=1 Tax=Porites lutea TaxID=51062 RepID=UPI003CC5C78B
MASKNLLSRHYNGRYSAKKVIFVLSFLSCAVSHVKSHPNRALADSEYTWFPKDAEDNIDFRRFPYNGELSEDEFEEFDDENLNDVESYDEKRSSFGLPSVTNYKRDPNSAMQRSFKNEKGYYLIEGAGHTVKGTKNLSVCNTNGVFSVGKIGGKNFIKSPTGWYLAIDSSGNVYMKKNRDNDTDIKTKLLPQFQRVGLYRKITSPTHRYFLSISPQSGTISEQNLTSTTAAKFRVRYGSGC